MTQGTLAQHVGIHVSQLRRYEAGSSSPTLDVLRKLAIARPVSSDTLVFDAERDSDEELRLQLEGTARLTDEDRQLVKRFVNGLLLSHEAKTPSSILVSRESGSTVTNCAVAGS